MNINKETFGILSHFSKFADAVVIKDGLPLYVCRDDKSIVARANVIVDTPEDLPIYNISLFVNIMKMFTDVEHSIEFEDNKINITSSDGKFSQEYYLGDQSILQVPTPAKADRYFEVECPVNFQLTTDDLKKFTDGININGASTVCIESRKGKVSLLAATIDAGGNVERSNQFRYDTNEKTDKEFRLGFNTSNFIFAPGDYEVSVNKHMIRFAGKTVSYVAPVLNWSEFED